MSLFNFTETDEMKRFTIQFGCFDRAAVRGVGGVSFHVFIG